MLAKNCRALVRRRLVLVCRTGWRRSAAGVRLGGSCIISRSRAFRCCRNGRFLGLSRFGGVQFGPQIRCHLLESFPVGGGVHGLREALRAGDLLQQELLASGHDVILLRCSVPQTNARRGGLLRKRQFEGLQNAKPSGPPAVRFLVSSHGDRLARARRRWPW
jgi:hypothetical protein